MPRYEIDYEVTQKHQVTRVVEAESLDEARSIARKGSPFEGEHSEHEGTRETLDWDIIDAREEE